MGRRPAKGQDDSDTKKAAANLPACAPATAIKCIPRITFFFVANQILIICLVSYPDSEMKGEIAKDRR